VIPGQTPPDEAARRVSQSLIRDRLVAALDWWVSLERSADVRAVLRVADPDGYREAVRDATLAKDRGKMVALAGQAEALTQPPGFTAFLGSQNSIPPERRRELVTAALGRRPSNLGLLMALGQSYSGNTTEAARHERVRWSQAAVVAAPWNPTVHYNLGMALSATGDYEGAIAALRETIRLAPEFVGPHVMLGITRFRRGDLDGAIASYREAIRLMPTHYQAHMQLGDFLLNKGDLDGAVAEWKEAIRHDPDHHLPLLDDRFRAAERGRELLPRLPDVTAGRVRPATPAEGCDWAEFCVRSGRPALGFRLFADAFAADPKLAEDLRAGHRYNAACCAALVVAGKDAELTGFGVEEWGILTDAAYRWLRTDLAAWTAQAKDPKNRASVLGATNNWRFDPDLIAVREPEWLAAMPPTDRTRWEALSAEVDALFALVSQPPPRGSGP
jgi:tetratricopeptide (TPR) repeat protein